MRLLLNCHLDWSLSLLLSNRGIFLNLLTLFRFRLFHRFLLVAPFGGMHLILSIELDHCLVLLKGHLLVELFSLLVVRRTLNIN